MRFPMISTYGPRGQAKVYITRHTKEFHCTLKLDHTHAIMEKEMIYYITVAISLEVKICLP